MGVLTLLGLSSDAAGPVGNGLASASLSLLGRADWLVPIAAIGLAALLLWRRHFVTDDDGEEYESDSPPRVRVGFGAALVMLSVIGWCNLAGGSPRWGSAPELLDQAGGRVGAALASPLASGGGALGAAVVFLSIGAFGALAALGISLHQVIGVVSGAARWTGEVLGDVLAFNRVVEEAEVVDLVEEEAAEAASTAGSRPSGSEPANGGDTPGSGSPLRPPRRASVELYDQFADRKTVKAAQVTDSETGDGEDEEDEELAEDEEYEYEEVEEDEELGEDEELAEDEEYEYEEDEYEEGEEDEEEGDELGEDEELADEELVEDEKSDNAAIEIVPVYEPIAWKLPAKTVLKRSASRTVDTRAIEDGGKVLETTLHEFGVDATLIGMTVGPTVTRYELELARGVKVNKVTGLSNDIAYAMASADVRILAPIPGRSAIGVEVPNKQRQLVTLGDILDSQEANAAVHPLEVGLGRDISGRSVMLNLATMPHLLIAGATGAGKSSCINSIITSILMRATPDQVRMILIDPKRVELGAYNDLPHLLTAVVTNPKKAANALDWAVREMDMRYELLAEVGVRDVTGYNAAYDRGEIPTREQPDPISGKGYDRLPFIVIVVDELNDLMMVAARDVEASICRIAQMARAVGIHLVIATQRPSVDVITGVIKANVPSRMAFSVSSLADSRVILDQGGAERLIGRGDLLIVTASSSRAQRIQGAWVDEECVRKVVAHWKRQSRETRYITGVADDTKATTDKGADNGDGDELLFEAMELVVRSGLGSTSMLQRKLRVGFARAGRIMDLLERKGVVGPSVGSKARDVLMSVEELDELVSGE